MTPDVPSVLHELAQLLVRNAQPGVPDAERTNALTLSSMLLSLAAEVWDGAAENLVQENRALAALLPDTADESDLRLSVLGAENAHRRRDRRRYRARGRHLGRARSLHRAAQALGLAGLAAPWPPRKTSPTASRSPAP
jgi:hypothetical protein